MKTRENLITVILPVYNGMPFLEAAVDSVLAQTMKHFRLLIIDDGSTDASADYLDSLGDPRVTVIHQKNRGLGDTLNRGIELCETKYLARMDADDIMAPERLEMQLDYMETHPDVSLLGTQIAFICKGQAVSHASTALDHEHIVESLMKGSAAVISHATIMCRSADAKRMGGYRVEGAGEELDFFLRMSEMGRVANLPDVLYHVRLHDSSLVMTRWAEIRRGYAYATHCAEQRRVQQPEPDMKAFCTQWAKRGAFGSLGDAINAWGVAHYRKGIMQRVSGHKKAALYHCVCATIGHPGPLFQRDVASLGRLARQWILN